MISHKKLAYNTILLFIRSVLTIIIGLIASRLLLQKLGVNSFGLYAVVGGVVAAFGSLRSFFSSAIQRFLNYARGKGENDRLSRIFSTGVLVQIIIALVLLILLESVGIYAVEKLNIEEGVKGTAHIVYQITILNTIVSMLTVPYDALIIAHERFNIYAFFSLMESFLRLLVIFLIVEGPFDKIVTYAFLLLCVSIIMRIINVVYCKRAFQEIKFIRVFDKELMKQMGSFASWNFLGNTGYTLLHEGVNYILNIFGGVVVNAARSIVYQVMNSVNTLIGNVNVAFKPQTNELAARNDKSEFYKMLELNAKAMLLLYVILFCPVLIFSEQLFVIWLGIVPEYTYELLFVAVIYYFIRSVHPSIDLFFNSIGHLKHYQLTELIFFLSNFPIIFIFLKFGFPLWSSFIIMSVTEICSQTCVMIVGYYKYGFQINLFLKKIYLPMSIMFVLSALCVYLSRAVMIQSHSNIQGFILVAILLILLFTGMSVLLFGMDTIKTVLIIVKNRFLK